MKTTTHLLSIVGLALVGSLLAGCGPGDDSGPGPLGQSLTVEPAARGQAGSRALTWIEQARLVAADGAANDRLGNAVAVHGATAVAGAELADAGANADQGAAYVFFRAAGAWAQQQKLVAPDGAADDRFGASVAIDRDTLVVGAPRNDVGANGNQGSIYVFVRSGTTWTLQQQLLASDGAAGDNLGISVALDDDTLLAGAFGKEGGRGAAYVFVRSGTTWTQQQRLVASVRAADDWFGRAVSLSGSTAAVGAPQDTVGSVTRLGSVTVFVQSGSTWSEQAWLTPNGIHNAEDHFGTSVSVSGDLLVAGSPGVDLGSFTEMGSAFVFARSGTSWIQERLIQPPDAGNGIEFGQSLALDGTSLAVGAWGLSSGRGAVYVFVQEGTTWPLELRLDASDGANGDRLGSAVAFAVDTLVAGATLDDVGTVSQQGSAYVFTRGLEIGDLCTVDSQCHSGFCEDGFCCDEYCGGSNPVDCRACSVAAGTYEDGICHSLRPEVRPTVVCRPATDICDFPETCSSGWNCPSDTLMPSTFECRAALDACDAPELCTGSSAACPADELRPSGWVCREAADACDRDESCDGASLFCPEDGYLPADQLCRAAAGPCDLEEFCPGVGPACPPDAFQFPSLVCRAATGACDLAELCTGSDAACPADALAPADLECRAAAGPCDLAEGCTGVTVDCPADALAPETQECRAAAGPCDQPERCTGASVDCAADVFRPASFECRPAADVCDLAERCDGSSAACPTDALMPAGLECRAASGTCDAPESCTGAEAACPADALQPDGFLCRPEAGFCDLAESCTGAQAGCPADALQGAGLACRPASCAAGVEIDPATCTGSDAACPAVEASPCAPYVCGADACLDTCATGADCAPGYACEEGACVSGGEPGDPCLAAAECRSGFCADGVCCDAACPGQCEACDVPGSEGTCATVEGAPRGDREPCLTDGSACGGACDGLDPLTCAYPGSAVICRPAWCADGVATLAASCRGDGACPDEETQDCAPEECDGDRCGGGCALDADCGPGAYCSAGVCRDQLADGSPCGGPHQCLGSRCVDEVCCESDCAGQCEACDLAGSEGVCSVVDGPPRGGRAACAGTGACAGACDGSTREACAFPAAGTACAEGACEAGVYSPAGTCDGAGGCVLPDQEICAPFACTEDGCLGACEDSSDCLGGFECRLAECRPFEAGSGCGCSAPGAAPDPAAPLGSLVILLGLAAWRRRRR